MTKKRSFEDRLNLIRQLLAKAESTTYPAEAKTFQERAEILMVRYGIEHAQLAGDPTRTENYVEKSYPVRGTYARVLHLGISCAVNAFGTTHTLISHSRNQMTCTVYILGAETDVDAMLPLCWSLEHQALYAMRTWWNTHKAEYSSHYGYTPSEQKQIRDSFISSFFHGVAARIESLVETEAEASGSKALVLDRRAKAKAFVDSLYPNVKNHKFSIRARGEGSEGYQYGFNARLNDTEIDTPAMSGIEATR